LTVEQVVEQTPYVETIQVVLEKELLRAADGAARRLKVNRSALVRQALRAHLATMKRNRLEQLDREGYAGNPERATETAVWDKVTAWPDE
jgi:metal-responsive CopG/Arc/MetJ family transcriptional regulator